MAEGGFSQVWRARDLIENRSIALKIPHPLDPGSEEEEELLHEIQLGSRLDHPGILRIKNADRLDGMLVIATELAQESLEERLTRRLSTTLALSFLEQLLEGLAHAHRHRIIHRDLKPSNLLIFPGNTLKISDFGLAKKVRRDMISATGSGTLQYIAPEQAHGYPCFASDVFSTGLIAHQLLTAKLPRWPFQWPFQGYETLQKKAPPELIRLVRKATAPRHTSRHRDALELLSAYRRIEPQVRKFLQPPRRPRSSRTRPRKGLWKSLRFREFSRSWGKLLHLHFECPDCQGPLSEHMGCCPWCGLEELSFVESTDFPCYCDRCHRGLRDEWIYCPWCWGPGFEDASGEVQPDSRYESECERCEGPLMQGMSYCPWCHAKQSTGTEICELPDSCERCGGSVDTDYWSHCPWCRTSIPRKNGQR